MPREVLTQLPDARADGRRAARVNVLEFDRHEPATGGCDKESGPPVVASIVSVHVRMRRPELSPPLPPFRLRIINGVVVRRVDMAGEVSSIPDPKQLGRTPGDQGPQ